MLFFLTVSLGLIFFIHPGSSHAAKVIYVSANLEHTQALQDNEKSPTQRATFLLLAAEQAIQNRAFSQGADYYYQLAKLTRTPLYAQKATRYGLDSLQPQLALKAATLWRQLEPDNQDAAMAQAYLLLLEANVSQALDNLVWLQGQDENYLINAGRLLPDNLSPYQESYLKQQLIEIAYSTGADPTKLLVVSLLFDDLRQSGLALMCIDNALVAKPKWPLAVVLRTDYLVKNNQIEQAKQYIEQQIKANPSVDYYKLIAAKIALRTEQPQKAKKYYQALTHHSEFRGIALVSLAHIALADHQYAKAQKYLQKATKLPKQANIAYLLLGQIAEVSGRYDDAIAAYTKVTAGNYYFPAQMRISYLLFQTKHIDAARNHLHQIDLTDTEQAKQVLLIESNMLLQSGNVTKAANHLNKSIQLYPDNIPLRYMRGYLSYETENLQLFEQDLRHILSLDPNQVEALNSLGFVLISDEKRRSEALAYLSKALALAPNDPDVLDSMGWLQYRMKQYQLALKYLHKAYGLDDNNEIAAHLGEVLWITGDKEQANDIWQKALERTPQDPIVTETIKRLKNP